MFIQKKMFLGFMIDGLINGQPQIIITNAAAQQLADIKTCLCI